MSEGAVFYSDAKGIRVTDRGVTLDNMTYAFTNFASIASRVERPSRVGPLLVIAVGVAFFVEGITGHSFGLAILAAIVVAVGGFWFKECKPVYSLDLSAVSGERAPILRGSEEWTTAVAMAINEAIARRTEPLGASAGQFAPSPEVSAFSLRS
ncbi:MAG: DUF6232 family protein [Candidatus Acidiferrales bacterium]